LADLNQAIVDAQAALDTTPPDHPNCAAILSNLAVALRIRFERTGDLADLDQAIVDAQAAVDATPIDHPNRAMFLSNLGLVRLARFERTADLADLDRAIVDAQAALGATPPDHPNWAAILSNLGLVRRARFARTGDLADLDQAIVDAQAAVDAAPPDHLNCAAFLSNLGIARLARFERTGDPADRDLAAACFSAGLGLIAASPTLRAQCGLRLAGILTESSRWVDAAIVWESVFELLGQVIDRALSWQDRQHHVGFFATVGTSAAATALHTHGTNRAWEWLEQGRGVMLGQALDTSTDPDLRRQRPDLAAQLDQIRARLNAEPTNPHLPEEAVGVAAQRRQAAQDWQKLVTTIRSTPEFIRFGQPPTIDELHAAISPGGTIVAVNVTRWRCDALILTPAGTDHCPLPNLTERDAIDHANQFLAATRSPGPTATTAIRDSLAWLWNAVCEPILNHLCMTSFATYAFPGPLPRVWWIPTGPLSVLPLHAATSDTGESVLDRVVSSYTPTVRMLARARRTGPPSNLASLIVGINDAPNRPPLTFAVAEAEIVAAAQGAVTQPLLNTAATVDAVRTALPLVGRAHFACHGAPAPDPADSHLALHDGPLPVREVANLALDDAYLAFLSACTTAFGGTTLLDESIHIASAFSLAGFRHVIATLWTINDRLALAITDTTYANLNTGMNPAYAVHDAIQTMRQRYPDHPYLWASYIHFGP
jgi:hypothetical protein